MEVLVVFGSAVDGSGQARDIDVAHDGEWGPEAEAQVREWAARQGLSANLPIDSHQVASEVFTPPEWTSVAGQSEILIQLPAPCGQRGPYEVIAGGNVSVHWREWRNFTSGLRAFGHDADVFFAAMAAKQFDYRISMMPPGEVFEGDPSGEWDKYCSGLKALRSAVRHAPAWPEISRRLAGGRLLAALVTADPMNWQNGYPPGQSGVISYSDGWSRALSFQVGMSSDDLRLGDQRVTEAQAARALGVKLV
jgi:hypothetical protein